MTKDQLTKFRAQIEADLTNLEGRTGTMRRELLQMAEVRPSPISDSLDHAKEESDLTTRLGLNERDVGRMARLRLALVRIEDGTFGLCEHCEEEIDTKRMEAQLTAALCFDCQSQKESSSFTTATRYAGKVAAHQGRSQSHISKNNEHTNIPEWALSALRGDWEICDA